MEIVVLVPARSGSKLVSNKNLQEINGKSLLEITIRSALESKSVSEIFVSSDSNKILDMAINFGCKLIKRPLDVASDSATANDVVKDFIFQTSFNKQPATLIIYLQPTSPFREYGLIERGIQLYLKESRPVVAVCEVNQHPYKTLVINEKNEIEPFLQNSDPTVNRQTLPRVVIPSGSLYVFSVADFISHGGIPIFGAIPLTVSGIYTFDLDTELDLRIAQKIGSTNEF